METHMTGDRSGQQRWRHAPHGSFRTDRAWTEQMVLWGRTGRGVLDQVLGGQLGPVARLGTGPHLLFS